MQWRIFFIQLDDNRLEQIALGLKLEQDNVISAQRMDKKTGNESGEKETHLHGMEFSKDKWREDEGLDSPEKLAALRSLGEAQSYSANRCNRIPSPVEKVLSEQVRFT
jgi:hypothetical protein